jgi:hypothetical protein
VHSQNRRVVGVVRELEELRSGETERQGNIDKNIYVERERDRERERRVCVRECENIPER